MSLKHLRVAAAGASFTLAMVKAVADYRRHGGHDKHSQGCDCLGGCTSCAVETAIHG